MVLWDKKGGEKGEKAELEFKKWLDKNKINHLYIKQDLKSFPKSFENTLRRPDFIIMLENIGMIMVEVRRRSIYPRYNTIPIDTEDLKKYIRFQSKFNIPIWYAVSNEQLNYKTWFWIPMSKIAELETPMLHSSKSKQNFIPISLDKFSRIEYNEHIGKIFSKNF